MGVILDKKVLLPRFLEGEAFEDEHMPNALRKAMEFAGDYGYVASIPQLLTGRLSSPEKRIWKSYMTFTEEAVGKTENGTPVVIVVHGGGVLCTPERVEKAFREGLTNFHAAKYTQEEFSNLLNGTFPSGRNIPVLTIKDLKGHDKLPMRYAVVMDYDKVEKIISGYHTTKELRYDDLFIARCGGIDNAHAYLTLLERRAAGDEIRYGNWHAFYRVDPSQPQGRLLTLGSDKINSICGDHKQFYLTDYAAFVAVSHEALLEREVGILEHIKQDPNFQLIKRAVDSLSAQNASVDAKASEETPL